MGKPKIDLTITRSKQQLKNLLDSVKTNTNNILTKEEQDYYVKEINFLITGARFSREDIKRDIAEGSADIDDIN